MKISASDIKKIQNEGYNTQKTVIKALNIPDWLEHFIISETRCVECDKQALNRCKFKYTNGFECNAPLCNDKECKNKHTMRHKKTNKKGKTEIKNRFLDL
jgi:hypothetical protein